MRTMHSAAEAILSIAEPRVQDLERGGKFDNTKEVLWNCVLDLRDLRHQIEARYPVLKATTRRPDGDPDLN